jgi:hypothetical protein
MLARKWLPGVTGAVHERLDSEDGSSGKTARVAWDGRVEKMQCVGDRLRIGLALFAMWPAAVVVALS